jgi:hypothetical protein
MLGQALGDLHADAAAATRDEGPLPLQVDGHAKVLANQA